jgi:hypothetical protein
MFYRPTDNQGNFELFLVPGTYHFIEPSAPGTWLLSGQTFVVPPDHSDMKLDLRSKVSPRATAR